MKENKLIILLIFNFALSFLCYGQSTSQERKDSLISSLDSSSYEIRYNAIQQIIEYKVIEALPKIEQLIWKQEHELQFNFLEAINELGSVKSNEYTLAYIDSVGNYSLFRNPLVYKIRALRFLFQHNDFSKTHYIFELLENGKNSLNISIAIDLLPIVYRNVPEYAVKAKQELEVIAFIAEDYLIRSRAIYYLYDLFKVESLPIIIRAFKEDADENNRAFIFNEYLANNINSEMNSLFQERLFSDPSIYLKRLIVENLLNYCNSPSVLNCIINFNSKNINNELFNHINYLLRDFSPSEPDSTIMINIMLDSLTSILNQVKQLNWVGDDQYVNSLSGKLVSSKNSLVNYDSASAALNIADFQNNVNTVYNDSLNPDAKFVKREGWQFLYYYSGYILKRLPSRPFYIEN